MQAPRHKDAGGGQRGGRLDVSEAASDVQEIAIPRPGQLRQKCYSLCSADPSGLNIVHWAVISEENGDIAVKM